MGKLFTVVRDMCDEDTDGAVRLLVNTDVPFSDEQVDRLADIIEMVTADAPTATTMPNAIAADQAPSITETISTAIRLATDADLQGVVDYEALHIYALLVLATDTEYERAVVYLKDCGGSPAHAKGRLLLRAAERALRAAGDLRVKA